MSELTGKLRLRQGREDLILQVQEEKWEPLHRIYTFYWRDAKIEDLTQFNIRKGELHWIDK